VAARANTRTNAERNDSRTGDVRGADIIGPYSTDVPDAGSAGGDQTAQPSPAAAEPSDIDPRSAIPLAAALAALLVGVWLARSLPRTLTCLAIAVLLALALNPLVEALRRRTRWSRTPCAAVVLMVFALVIALVLALVVPPTFREVRSFRKQVPTVVKNLDHIPIFGKNLRKAHAQQKVRKWLDDLPDRLSVQQKPAQHVVGTIADGIGAFLLTILFAVTLLIDGELVVSGLRRMVPERHRRRADRLGALVYDVLGRYIAGSLLMAALAGTVMLTGALVFGVPLAPLIGVWVAVTNPIPQVGGALGGAVFVLLGVTQGIGTGIACLLFFLTYQQLENHVLQPLIVGRAVRLSPPATMVAALVGVSAGGLVGALFAVPLLGATKAIYLSVRPPPVET
jgi:predicted PurR-regulated permease PerM